MPWYFWVILVPTGILVGLRTYASIREWREVKRYNVWHDKVREESRLGVERDVAIEAERWAKLTPDEQAAELAHKKAEAERRHQELLDTGWQVHYPGAYMFPRELMSMEEVHLLHDPDATLTQPEQDAGWKIVEIGKSRYKALPYPKATVAA